MKLDTVLDSDNVQAINEHTKMITLQKDVQ